MFSHPWCLLIHFPANFPREEWCDLLPPAGLSPCSAQCKSEMKSKREIMCHVNYPRAMLAKWTWQTLYKAVIEFYPVYICCILIANMYSFGRVISLWKFNAWQLEKWDGFKLMFSEQEDYTLYCPSVIVSYIMLFHPPKTSLVTNTQEWLSCVHNLVCKDIRCAPC